MRARVNSVYRSKHAFRHFFEYKPPPQRPRYRVTTSTVAGKMAAIPQIRLTFDTPRVGINRIVGGKSHICGVPVYVLWLMGSAYDPPRNLVGGLGCF